MGSYSPPPGFPESPPEILPPHAAASYAQEEELRAVRDRVPGHRSAPDSVRRSWAYAPATYLLVGINCAVFLAMLLHHVSFWNPTSQDLLDWQGNQAAAVMYGEQWWRVVTAMFVHVGIIHLA